MLHITNKKSVFKTFFISYIIMLIVPTMIGTANYISYSRNTNANIEKYNLAMLEQAQKVIDERLKNLQQFSLDICFNPEINAFTGIQDLQPKELYQASKVIKELGLSTSVNNDVKEIFVYYNNSDLVLSSESKDKFEFYYEQNLEKLGYSINQWKEWFKHFHNNDYFKTEKNIQEEGYTIFIQSIPFGLNAKPKAHLVLLIEDEMMNEIFNNMTIYDDSIFLISDNNNIIAYSGNDSLINDYEFNLLNYDDTVVHEKIKDKSYVIFYKSSNVFNWKYINAIPVDKFMKEAHEIRNITFIIIACGMFVGVILAILMTRENTAPLNKIIKQLLDNKIEKRDIKNEWNYIEKSILNVVKENKDVKNNMKKQYPMLQSGLLTKLIYRSYNDIDEVGIALQSLHIEFPYEFFSILYINIIDCKDPELKKQWALVKFIITNIFEELGNKNAYSKIVDIEWSQLVLIVNLKNDREWGKDQLTKISKDAINFITNKFPIQLDIGVSDIHFGLNELHNAYMEAKKAAEYSNFIEHKSIFYFKEIVDNNDFYYYPIELENQLINNFKTGNSDKVKGIVDEIFNRNFKEETLTIELSKCLFFDIMSTILKIINDIKIDYKLIFGEDFNAYEVITECSTTKEMYDTILWISDEVCSYINNNRESHNDFLKEKVLEYVKNNYQDINFNLSSLASAYDLNSSYLSRFFKEQTGQNFVNYLRIIRINKVKELLLSTDLSIDDIAQQVGYSSSGVLIRNFKKIVGITPGQYREKKR